MFDCRRCFGKAPTAAVAASRHAAPHRELGISDGFYFGASLYSRVVLVDQDALVLYIWRVCRRPRDSDLPLAAGERAMLRSGSRSVTRTRAQHTSHICSPIDLSIVYSASSRNSCWPNCVASSATSRATSRWLARSTPNTPSCRGSVRALVLDGWLASRPY